MGTASATVTQFLARAEALEGGSGLKTLGCAGILQVQEPCGPVQLERLRVGALLFYLNGNLEGPKPQYSHLTYPSLLF